MGESGMTENREKNWIWHFSKEERGVGMPGSGRRGEETLKCSHGAE